MASFGIKNGPVALALFQILLLFCQVAGSARTLNIKDGATKASVTLVENPKWKLQNVSRTALQASTYLKTKTIMPPALQAAWDEEQANQKRGGSRIRPRDTGYMTDLSGGYYLFPVEIGTPAKPFNLLFDTGSSDLWTWGWEMAEYSGLSLAGHNYYNVSRSSTGVSMPGESFEACYGSGCVGGNMGYDTILVDTIEVTGNPLPWILWEQDTGLWDDTGIDGILGLGLSYNDAEFPDPQQTWVSYVCSVLSPLEGFTLTFTSGGDSIVDFGWIDEDKYTGSISYVDVTQWASGETFWSFWWDGFSIGSGAFNSTSFFLLTDTGGTYCAFPESVVNEWYAAIEGGTFDSQGNFVFPCDAELPNINFGIGEGLYTVYGSLFNYGTSNDVGYCWTSLYTTPDDSYAYMGLPFFYSLFVVHDLGNNRMGFGNRHTGL
jgi:hypothetical protein